MRSKSVIRYYCDHCNKGGFKKRGMADHELACIKNPARSHCWLCAQVPQETNQIKFLIAALKESMDALRMEAHGCPACMLAAIVQYSEPFSCAEESWIEFDYKTEKEAFLNSLRPAHEIMGF